MVLLTVLNILVCAGTLVTVLAAKREIKGLGQEVSELYDVVEEAEDKIKALDKKFLELDNGINFVIDGNQEMFNIIEKIDKDQEENLDNLKEFIEDEHGKLHTKIAFTPLKVVQVGGQDGRA